MRSPYQTHSRARARAHIHTHTHARATHARTIARARAHTHTHTHTHMCVLAHKHSMHRHTSCSPAHIRSNAVCRHTCRCWRCDRRHGTELNKELGSSAHSPYASATQTWLRAQTESPDRRGSPDSSGRNTPIGKPPRPRPTSAPPLSQGVQGPTPLVSTPDRRKSVALCTSAMADFAGLKPFPKRHPHIVHESFFPKNGKPSPYELDSCRYARGAVLILRGLTKRKRQLGQALGCTDDSRAIYPDYLPYLSTREHREHPECPTQAAGQAGLREQLPDSR